MSGFYPQGMTLKALLENPSLLNPPKHQQKKDTAITTDGNKLKDIDDGVIDFGSAFLGPTLWDNTLPYNGNDFKLEYMDLDEFLSENGIPINPAASPPQQQQTTVMSNNSAPTSPVNSIPSSPHSAGPTPFLSMTAAASPPRTPSSAPSLPVSPVVTPTKEITSIPFTNINIGSHSPNSQVEKHINSPTVQKPESIQPEFSPQNSNQSWDAMSDISANEPGSPSYEPTQKKRVRSKSITDEDRVATIPGQDGFDPCNHKFSEDELKPQPMIKKSKKVFVPDDLKDDKYWARRKKNNIAAKRSRDARRVKENQIAMRASFLEDQYTQMKEMLEATQKENKILKEKLAKYEKTQQ